MSSFLESMRGRRNNNPEGGTQDVGRNNREERMTQDGGQNNPEGGTQPPGGNFNPMRRDRPHRGTPENAGPPPPYSEVDPHPLRNGSGENHQRPEELERRMYENQQRMLEIQHELREMHSSSRDVPVDNRKLDELEHELREIQSSSRDMFRRQMGQITREDQSARSRLRGTGRPEGNLREQEMFLAEEHRMLGWGQGDNPRMSATGRPGELGELDPHEASFAEESGLN